MHSEVSRLKPFLQGHPHVSRPKQFIQLMMKKFKEEETTGLASQLAYAFLLSVFPLLLFMLTLLPYLSINKNQILTLVEQDAPQGTGDLIGKNVHSLLTHPNGGLLVVSIVLTLWSASNGVSSLFRALNHTYEAQPKRSFVKQKALALGFTLAMVVVIAITLMVPVFGHVILRFIQTLIPLSSATRFLYQVFSWAFSIAVAVVVLAAIYSVAPDKRVPIRETFWGALVATIGWHVISLGFSFYISNFGHYSRMYGTLGGIMVLMIWFYLTGLILIVGGQVNATLRQMNGEAR